MGSGEEYLLDLTVSPISVTKVRNGVYAYKYPNGCVNIRGQKFFLYSIKNAIKMWRKKNPITRST